MIPKSDSFNCTCNRCYTYSSCFPDKNENKTAAHIGVGLTLIAAIMFFVTGFMRNNMIVIVMAIFTTLALFMYIMDFKRRKQEREG
ncbi:MAG: hypothetical protein R3A12_20250 [Ignavibacteria bacterium]